MRLHPMFISILMLASAYAMEPFDKVQFQKDLEEKKPVVIQVSVPWCGHCMMQKRALKSFEENPKYADYGYYQLPRSGADEAKAYLNTHFIEPYLKTLDKDNQQGCNLKTRSTLVVISENKVTSCSAFETNKDLIEVMLNSA